MASIGDLPPEILTRIFYRLRPFEWLLLEVVCRRWKDIVVSVWSQLRCIDEEAIGFPKEDFAGNFIEIAKRIRVVKRFINPLALASHSQLIFDDRCGRSRNHPSVQEQLVAAMHDLVGKRSPDAAFPLDLIQSLERRDKCGPDADSIRRFLERAMKECDVAEFSAIRLDQVLLHEKMHYGNPLEIARMQESIPLPLDHARITRIVIGQLAILVSTFVMNMGEALGEIAAWRTRFSSFPNLQQVEVETMEVVLRSCRSTDPMLQPLRDSPEREPWLSMRISFAEGSCVFAVDEFNSFLQALSSIDEDTRYDQLLEKITTWRDGHVIKGVAIRIHSEMFDFADVGILLGSDSESLVGGRGYPSFKHILDVLFPELVDKVHLTMSTSYEEAEDLLGMLRKQGVFHRVKEFSVSYVEARRGFMEFSVPKHDSKAFLTEAYNVVQPVCDEMTRLEVLRLNLEAGGNVCAFPKVANVPVVKQPLPLLQLVEINGFPCFPFLSSIVQHAVNLKQLVITSQPFSSDYGGLQRVIKFLEPMQECRNLAYFSFKAWNPMDMMFMGTGRVRRRPRSEKVEGKVKPILPEMERHLVRLGNTMPNLLYVAVTIARCEYKYEMDRRGR